MDLDAPKQPCYSRGCFGIPYFVWTAIFFYFTFYNPDKGFCWAKEGIDEPRSGDEFLNGYILVNTKFTNWFMWNFILYSVHAVLSLLFTIFPIINQLFYLG